MGFSLDVSVPVLTVFLQGLLSFFSPCVFPLIPLYIGYLSGGTGVRGDDGRIHYERRKVLLHTLFFIVGVSFAFFLLGFGFSAMGTFFRKNQMLFARIGGILVMLFGLYQLGIFGSSRVLGKEHRLPLKLSALAMSPITALFMGFTFSFAWTPCVGPALASVLLMAASANTKVMGLLLIGVYTVGFVLPFLAVGFFTTSLLELFKKHRKIVNYTVKIGGVLMVLMGLMMYTGKMNSITGYLSQVPVSKEARQEAAQGSAADGTVQPSSGQPAVDGAVQPTPGQPAVDGTVQPSPGHPAADGAVQPSPGHPAADGTAQPSPGQPSADGAVQPSSGHPAADGAAQPSSGHPAADGAAQPSSGQPSADGAVQPSSGQPAADGASQPSSGQTAAGETGQAPDSELLPALDFTLKDQYGNTHTLGDYKGKTIFLNFWATWCPPCRAEMPDIQKLYDTYKKNNDDSVVILGVAGPMMGGEKSEDEIRKFLKDGGYTYPVLMDTDGSLFMGYGIFSYPTTYMIDENGNVFGYASGQLSTDTMKRIIAQTKEGKRR